MGDHEENGIPAHWCTQLFPPTFTREDVLEVSFEGKRSGGLPKDYYTDVYTHVVLEEKCKNRRVKEVAKHMSSEHEPCSISDPSITDIEPSKANNLWSGEELQLFRKAYTKLKEKSVKLLCIIETKNIRINEVKKENALMTKQLKQKDKLIMDLMKEKTIFQEYSKSHEKICNDLEYKLQFYEDCNNDLKEVILRKDKELCEIKSELLTQKKVQEENGQNLEKLNREHMFELLSLKETLNAQYKCDIIPLRKEIDNLVTSKRLCEEQCTQFKNSFLDLQRHFVEGKVSSSQRHVDAKKGKEFLGIADLN